MKELESESETKSETKSKRNYCIYFMSNIYNNVTKQ